MLNTLIFSFIIDYVKSNVKLFLRANIIKFNAILKEIELLTNNLENTYNKNESNFKIIKKIISNWSWVN